MVKELSFWVGLGLPNNIDSNFCVLRVMRCLWIPWDDFGPMGCDLDKVTTKWAPVCTSYWTSVSAHFSPALGHV
ncbi:unnamed protein product [Linum trigynum]|uniref:Uncharacterized protein n=1 Tax=Linum trigynum TaxID=586398 RepID=A0AAV2FNS8_9ROSI